MFSVCDLCFFFLSKKFVLTEKSKKNKLICVSVYVWDCDLYFYLFIYFLMREKYVLTKKSKKKKKKIQADLCFYICLTIQYKYMHHGFLIMP